MNSKIRQLESVAMRNGVIELEWRDNSHSRFHPIWLRDNCRCAECGDHGICFLQGAPAETGVVEALGLRFGFPQESNFGRVQDLVFNPQKRSIANDIKALKPHTDEPYRASPPGILLFHCITNDQTGAGSSTFVDGFEIAERLRTHDAEGFLRYAIILNHFAAISPTMST
jgi:alpha-ketoglutarate-dependent taurine dioxygenase